MHPERNTTAPKKSWQDPKGSVVFRELERQRSASSYECKRKNKTLIMWCLVPIEDPMWSKSDGSLSCRSCPVIPLPASRGLFGPIFLPQRAWEKERTEPVLPHQTVGWRPGGSAPSRSWCPILTLCSTAPPPGLTPDDWSHCRDTQTHISGISRQVQNWGVVPNEHLFICFERLLGFIIQQGKADFMFTCFLCFTATTYGAGWWGLVCLKPFKRQTII